MGNNRSKLAKSDWISLSAFSLFVVFYYLYFIKVIEGDPTIYLSFAKNFFNMPFSFGSTSNISFGATSPAYLFFLSIFYLFGLDLFLILHKIFNCALLIFAVFICIKNTSYILASSKSNNISIGFICVVAILLNINIVDNSARHYESAFVLFFTAILMHFFLQGRLYATTALASFSYLVRPEIVSIQILFVLFLLYSQNKLFTIKAIPVFLISLSPLILYHFYMYENTGAIIPSSIISRAIRSSDSSYLSSIIYLLRTNSQIFVFFAFCSLLGARYILNNNLKIFSGSFGRGQFAFYSSLSIGLILLASKSFSTRYFEFVVAPIVPFLAVLVCSYVNEKIRQKFYVACLAMLFLFITFKVIRPDYRNDSYLSNRLDKNFAEKFNHFADSSEKIALYEVELQYYINATVVSLDARVGNQMIPFFTGKEDLLSAMQRHSIKYLGVDEHVSPRIRRDEFYQFLLAEDSKLAVGSEVSYKNIRIKKIIGNDNLDIDWKMWGSIYQIYH